LELRFGHKWFEGALSGPTLINVLKKSLAGWLSGIKLASTTGIIGKMPKDIAGRRFIL
jgi:hypothetical protein